VTASTVILLIASGCLIGLASGLTGIGGGVLVIPLLVLIFHFKQQQAIGTSLAMLLPPIGILAVIDFYRHGNVNVPVAALLACGFAVGVLGGSQIVNRGVIGEHGLRIIFGVLLLYVAGRNLFGGSQRAALNTHFLMTGFGLTWVLLRMLGRKWITAARWADVYRAKLKESHPYDYEI